jgi:hypothetical protein
MANFRLADVVKELRIQNSLSEQTNRDILSLTKKFADLLLQQSIDKQQELIDRQKAAETALEAGKKSKEAVRDRQNSAGGFGSSLPSGLIDGFLKGSGLGWLGNLVGGVFSNIFKIGGAALGLLTGGIGFAAGKLLKWGFFGGLIVNYFSDEITNWLDPDGDGKMQFMGMEWDANDAKFWGGLSIAAGFIATSLIGFVGSSIIGLGSLGLAALFMKIPGLKDIGLAMDTWARGKTPFMQPKRPITPTPENLKPLVNPVEPNPLAKPAKLTPTPRTPFQELNTKIGEALKGGGKLPEGYKITKLGQIQNAQGKFIGAAELTQIAETLKSPVNSVNLSQKVSNLSGKALGVGLKAVNVAMIADFFLNPASLGFQNLSASDMGSYEEAELEKIRKIFSKEGSAGIGQVLKYLNTKDPNLKDDNGNALTIADMTGLKSLVEMPRNDLIDIANKVRMNAIASGEQSISSTGQTVGIASVSSARLLGQGGSIAVGSELNALDVISEQRNNLSRLNTDTQMPPVVNSSSTVNNQQFESFYFGGGTSMDVYDTTGLKLSWR